MRIIEVGTTLWKKCWATDIYSALHGHSHISHCAIVELEVVAPGICADFESIVNGKNNDEQKCRVRAARVVSIVNIDDNDRVLTKCYSSRDIKFVYTVGDTVYPKRPFDESNVACGSGIHGFEDRDDAVNYQL